MKGRMVTAWHDSSPGSVVTIWRPWWRRKRRPFATPAEVLRSHRPLLDARPVRDVNPYIPDPPKPTPTDEQGAQE